MFSRRSDEFHASSRLESAKKLASGIVAALIVFGLFQSQTTAGSTTIIYNNGTS